MFQQRQVGKTLITRTQGTKVRGLHAIDVWAHAVYQYMTALLYSEWRH